MKEYNQIIRDKRLELYEQDKKLYSRTQVARRASVSEQALERIENKINIPTNSLAQKLVIELKFNEVEALELFERINTEREKRVKRLKEYLTLQEKIKILESQVAEDLRAGKNAVS